MTVYTYLQEEITRRIEEDFDAGVPEAVNNSGAFFSHGGHERINNLIESAQAQTTPYEFLTIFRGPPGKAACYIAVNEAARTDPFPRPTGSPAPAVLNLEMLSDYLVDQGWQSSVFQNGLRIIRYGTGQIIDVSKARLEDKHDLLVDLLVPLVRDILQGLSEQGFSKG